MKKEEFKKEQDELLKSVYIAKDWFETLTDRTLTDNALIQLKMWVKQFGEDMVLEAIKESVDRYHTGTLESTQNAFSKIGGICYNWSCVE